MAKTIKKIKQKHHLDIGVYTQGQEVIQIIAEKGLIYDRIEIERSSLPKLIKILQGEVGRI